MGLDQPTTAPASGWSSSVCAMKSRQSLTIGRRSEPHERRSFSPAILHALHCSLSYLQFWALKWKDATSKEKKGEWERERIGLRQGCTSRLSVMRAQVCLYLLYPTIATNAKLPMHAPCTRNSYSAATSASWTAADSFLLPLPSLNNQNLAKFNIPSLQGCIFLWQFSAVGLHI